MGCVQSDLHCAASVRDVSALETVLVQAERDMNGDRECNGKSAKGVFTACLLHSVCVCV